MEHSYLSPYLISGLLHSTNIYSKLLKEIYLLILTISFENSFISSNDLTTIGSKNDITFII